MITQNPHLTIRLAESEPDKRAAERLRYQVFVRELGGDGPLVDHRNALERDRFDPFADQLILVDNRRDAKALDHVVGVYRLLSATGADRAGQYYSESEYDLTVLRQSGRKLLELGRSCVYAEYRGGVALFMLWHGLAEYVRRNGYEILFGVASFHGVAPKMYATHLSYLYHHHLTPADLRVTVRSETPLPMNSVPAADIDRLAVMRSMPPLIKAYLRIGGFVGDGAFVDASFNTTDVCLVLDVARMTMRQSALYGADRQVR
ncbi:MAG: GNAT family N-acetyltransferase [Paracoccaceae bacterium]